MYVRRVEQFVNSLKGIILKLAIYHFSGQIISRINSETNRTRSVVACAAYRSGEKLEDIGTGEIKYYHRKVMPESYMLVPANAPDWAMNREVLWNKVEQTERAYNAQLAREFNVALPVELSKEEQTRLAKNFCKKAFVDKGMVADLSIHRDDMNNPHFHVMLTMREFDENGNFKPKSHSEYVFDRKCNRKRIKVDTNDWNNKDNIKKWRKLWETMANEALRENNIDAYISCDSNRNRNIEFLPSKHEGYVVRKLEENGIETEIGSINRDIAKYNKTLTQINEYKKKKEDIVLTNIARCFSPTERKILKSSVKELGFYINEKNLNDRVRQLEKWENSLLYANYDDKKIDRIFSERNTIEKLNNILESEASRFINKYYSTVNLEQYNLSNSEKIAIVDETVNRGMLLSSETIISTIQDYRQNELKDYICGIFENTNGYSFHLFKEIQRAYNIIDQEEKHLQNKELATKCFEYSEVKKIDSAQSMYHIYQAGNNASYFIGIKQNNKVYSLSNDVDIAEAKQLWKRAYKGDLTWSNTNLSNNEKIGFATQRLEKLEAALEVLEKMYDLYLVQEFPDINIEKYNLLEKEVIINVRGYHKDIALEDINIKRYNKPIYNTVQQKEILDMLATDNTQELRVRYPEFRYNNETYKNMFIYECRKNTELNYDYTTIFKKYDSCNKHYYRDSDDNVNIKGERKQNYGTGAATAAFSLLMRAARDDSSQPLNKKRRRKKHQQIGLT